MSINANMAIARNFEVICDTFNAVGICTGFYAQKWITNYLIT